MTPRWRTSRLARSELTFGGVGRVVATLLLLSPVYLALDLAGVFGVVFVVPYLLKVVPEGLRWLWQPVPVELVDDPSPATDLPSEPLPAATAIADREAPGRW